MADINTLSSQEPSPEKGNQHMEDVPSELIIFSELSKEEKVKYFNFFLANDTLFTKEKEGTYLADIEILGEEEIKPIDLNEGDLKNSGNYKKTKSNLRSSGKKNYEEKYSSLLNTINMQQPIKGNKMKLCNLRCLIQEIYSMKFMKETQNLMSQADSEPEEFSVFVANFLTEKYGKKKSLEKTTCDLILSIDFYSLTFKDIKVFQLFLEGEYDNDDLIFYLFLRSCIEKEMQIFFLDKSKEDVRVYQGYAGFDYETDNDDIMVPLASCKNIARSVFGVEEKKLAINFLKKIEESCKENKKTKKLVVPSNTILNLGVSDYHNSRANPSNEDDKIAQNMFNNEDEQEQYIDRNKGTNDIRTPVKQSDLENEEKPKTVKIASHKAAPQKTILKGSNAKTASTGKTNQVKSKNTAASGGNALRSKSKGKQTQNNKTNASKITNSPGKKKAPMKKK